MKTQHSDQHRGEQARKKVGEALDHTLGPGTAKSLFNNIDKRLEDGVNDGYENITISQRPKRCGVGTA